MCVCVCVCVCACVCACVHVCLLVRVSVSVCVSTYSFPFCFLLLTAERVIPVGGLWWRGWWRRVSWTRRSVKNRITVSRIESGQAPQTIVIHLSAVLFALLVAMTSVSCASPLWSFLLKSVNTHHVAYKKKTHLFPYLVIRAVVFCHVCFFLSICDVLLTSGACLSTSFISPSHSFTMLLRSSSPGAAFLAVHFCLCPCWPTAEDMCTCTLYMYKAVCCT